jgi:hypothetical protein
VKSLGVAFGHGRQLESAKEEICEKTSPMFQYYIWEHMQEIEEGIPYILPFIEANA